MNWGKCTPGILQIKKTIPIPGGPAVVMSRGEGEALYLANYQANNK